MRAVIIPLLAALPTWATAADNLIGMGRFRIATDTVVPDDTQVEFYTSKDGGRSWQQVPAAQVTRPQGGRPGFVFTATKDGAYGFWTRLLPAQGQSEAAPRPGDKPEISYMIDTTPPRIELFSSALEKTSAGFVLMATWAVEDPHLTAKPVQLQASLASGGDWVDLGEPQPASGRCRIPVPQERLRLRLVVSDRAGNRSSSPAAIPVVIGSAAVTAAPNGAAAAPAAQPVTPQAADTTNADTTHTATAGTDPAAADTAQPAAAGDETTATGATAPAPAAIPSLDEMEAQVDRELATAIDPAASQEAGGEQGAAPAPTSQPQDPMAIITQRRPEALYRWPEPGRAGAEESELLAAADAVLAERQGRLLLGDQATVVLAAARAAALGGDLRRAADFYGRLHDSDRAADALPEEVMLLQRLGLRIRAEALAEQAPPEARSPALLLSRAYVGFTTDPARSLDLLKALPPDAPCHQEAQILRARCMLALEKPQLKPALVILRSVARIDDRFGAHAQELVNLLERE